MARQLALDLAVTEALGRADFFTAPSNRLAVEMLAAPWPDGKLVLTGPAGAGKTHLARVWAGEAGAVLLQGGRLALADPGRFGGAPAVAVDDADRVAGDAEAEAALFHLHNLVLASGGRLLLTASRPPARWALVLPDLASRLEATATVALDPPDDALLGAVLVKLFADRQLAVSPSLIHYLARHVERSLAAAGALVAALDARALAEGRAVTRAMAAELLDIDGADAP